MRKLPSSTPAVADEVISKGAADALYSKVTVDGAFQSVLDISSVPVSQLVRLSTDITTTVTTIADALVFASVPAGTYALDAYMLDQSGSTTIGPRFALGGSATATIGSFTVEQATSATARTTTVGTALATLYGTNIATVNTSFGVNVHASFVVTAGGSFGVRWGMSGSATGTLKAGSYAILTRQ